MLAAGLAYLADKGLDLLWDTVQGLTDTGVKKVKEEVKKATGIDITKKDQVMDMTPEQYAEVRGWELDNKKFLAQVQLDHKRLDNEDRANARDMLKESIKHDGDPYKVFLCWYASLVTLATFIYVGCVTFIEIPASGQRIADTCVGFMLGTLLASIIHFLFGTSQGSQKKTAAMSAALQEKK